MSRKKRDVVDLGKARLEIKARKGYRNWESQFEEDFGLATCLHNVSDKTLRFLAQGGGNSHFYLYDLIMNLQGFGSGFEFNELDTKEKMMVMDRHLFLLDRIRFEYMKRSGCLKKYPGESFPIAELIINFDQLAPGMQAKIPELSSDHPAYKDYCKMEPFAKEELIRKLLHETLKEIQDH